MKVVYLEKELQAIKNSFQSPCGERVVKDFRGFQDLLRVWIFCFNPLAGKGL